MKLKSTYFPGFKAFIDSSEQEIPRPTKNKRKRKSYYSGKKKKHTTVKTQYMVNSEGLVLHNTEHKKGRKHDYDVYKNNHPVTPLQVENVFDLGYIGVKNDYPIVKMYFQLERKGKVNSQMEKRDITESIPS